MTTLGLIGSGNIGSTVARLAIAAGLDVVLSNSRGPQTLAELVAELGPRARAATAEEAGAAGDIVVVAVPLRNYQQIPVAPLAGKVVIDAGNYYPDRDGTLPELADGAMTTSELLQKQLPTSKVVKAFNNIYFLHLAALARPVGSPDRTALPIAGDDVDAKAAAAQLLDVLGYDTVDAGPLSESWRFQPNTPAYTDAYATGVPFWEKAAAPADAAKIRALLAAAQH
ncbi:NADPH-dependent F420 reductase [Nocardia suismassiliense]|uniref:NADPH-dependent F420 reductase n=1 Tax=Nocardia suismassiliense TaxID=2077092 RepID=UPI000D1D7549|nr:NAD(P)-binding domain-containing protein [Nocardia suismassiliense]